MQDTTDITMNIELRPEETSTTKGSIEIESGSFQDRTSRVFYQNDKIYRILNDKAAEDWHALRNAHFFKTAMTKGSVVATCELKLSDNALDANAIQNAFPEVPLEGLLEHDVIPVVSYPYEWSFTMLKDAALLHLSLMEAALEDNFIIKDATTFNIQWAGTQPVFIDTPSFEPWVEGEPWAAYRQFCQMFLYPLMLKGYKNVDFHPWLRGSVHGIEPHEIDNLFGFFERFKPGVMTHVHLHAKLQAQYLHDSQEQKKLHDTVKKTMYPKALILNNVRSLKSLIQKLEWDQSTSIWSDYAKNNSYSSEEIQDKIDFVGDVAKTRHWKQVWDIGCNTGTFSKIAAEHADYVLALDADHLSIDMLYQHLRDESNKDANYKFKNILPLVLNLADPSPDLGWRCKERKSMTSRSKPELILCLALIHHMVIRHNVPVREFVDWLGSYGSEMVIEFVNKDDIMVKTLLLGKADQYTDYEQDYFESCLKNWFDIKRQDTSKTGTRILYHVVPKK